MLIAIIITLYACDKNATEIGRHSSKIRLWMAACPVAYDALENNEYQIKKRFQHTAVNVMIIIIITTR
jgi:hypothetical protein